MSKKNDAVEKLKALGVPDADAEVVHEELVKQNLNLGSLVTLLPKLLKVLPLIKQLIKELGGEFPDVGLAPKE